MDEWCTKQHASVCFIFAQLSISSRSWYIIGRQTGLTQNCLISPYTKSVVSRAILSYVKKWIPYPRIGVLAGNSVHADRSFLLEEMPELIDWLHYRYDALRLEKPVLTLNLRQHCWWVVFIDCSYRTYDRTCSRKDVSSIKVSSNAEPKFSDWNVFRSCFVDGIPLGACRRLVAIIGKWLAPSHWNLKLNSSKKCLGWHSGIHQRYFSLGTVELLFNTLSQNYSGTVKTYSYPPIFQLFNLRASSTNYAIGLYYTESISVTVISPTSNMLQL